jgi:hypothetical protein
MSNLVIALSCDESRSLTVLFQHHLALDRGRVTVFLVLDDTIGGGGGWA